MSPKKKSAVLTEDQKEEIKDSIVQKRNLSPDLVEALAVSYFGTLGEELEIDAGHKEYDQLFSSIRSSMGTTSQGRGDLERKKTIAEDIRKLIDDFFLVD